FRSLDFTHFDCIVYLAAFERSLHLLRSEGTRFSFFEFPLARRGGDDHNWAILECELIRFFSLRSPVSLLRHSRISALAFIQFGGHFGWRQFQSSRLRPRLHGSTAFFLCAIVWLIGEMNQWKYVT